MTNFIFSDIIGDSQVMRDLTNKAKRASTSRSPIMITGETGTGKELLAQSIHSHGIGKSGPFVSINCSAIPETLIESTLFGTNKGAYTDATNSLGLFEEANNGTLFLDELNSMSLNTQAKILRTLQDHKIRRVGSTKEIHVDCRVISALNVDTSECIARGQLRADLFYRLSAVTLDIPPLRLRRDDILTLAYFFIKQYNGMLGRKISSIKTDISVALKEHNWPGNVRELQHIIEHTLNMADKDETDIQMKHLPSYFIKVSFSTTLSPLGSNEFSSYKNKKPQLPTTLSPLESNELSNYKNKKAKALREFEKEFTKPYIINAWNQSGGRLGKSADLLGLSRQQLYNLIKKYNITLKGN